jgi:hypothetical protein
VRVAISFLPFRVTVPTGATQGDAQVNVKLALPVIGFIGSLKAATISVVLIGTPVALLSGVTAVTVGGAGGPLSMPSMGD